MDNSQIFLKCPLSLSSDSQLKYLFPIYKHDRVWKKCTILFTNLYMLYLSGCHQTLPMHLQVLLNTELLIHLIIFIQDLSRLFLILSYASRFPQSLHQDPDISRGLYHLFFRWFGYSKAPRQSYKCCAQDLSEKQLNIKSWIGIKKKEKELELLNCKFKRSYHWIVTAQKSLYRHNHI